MRKNITRTITTTKIHAVEVKFDGDDIVKVDIEPIEVAGTITKEKALKKVSALQGDGTYIIKNLETVENYYVISVSDFLKHATKVDKLVEEEEDGEEQ